MRLFLNAPPIMFRIFNFIKTNQNQMNKNSLLLATMLLLSSYGFAQKLSPSTSLMLQEVASGQKKAKAADGKVQSVSSFVTIKSPEAIEKMEKLGAKVNTRVSETLVTATLPITAIDAISQLDEVVSVSVGTEARLLMDQARSLLGVDDCHKMTENNGPYTGKGVVVGIVDNGFQYDHADFLNADKSDTRIKRVWDQHGRGNAPEAFGYGTEYKSYAEMQAARYDLTSGFHATHVSGIAAGGDKSTPYYGVAPDADLVFVSFDTSNSNIVDGIKYVFDYAESVGKPAVVNISLGSHMGPHDGTSDTDLSFAQLVGPGRIIVGACGNEGLEKLHAGKTLTASSNQLKTMFAYGSSQDNSQYRSAYVDVWGDKNSTLAVKAVVVNTLNGKVVAESEEVSTDGTKEISWIAPDGSGVVAQVGLSLQVNPNNNRSNVLVMSRATSINTGFAVGLVVTGKAGDTIHMWNNATGGEFTSFNKRGWTDGDTNYTVGELGGESPDVISVGSFNSKMFYQPIALQGTDYGYGVNEELVGTILSHSNFSSYGPSADGRVKPDITAPGCIIISAGSRYCGGWDDETNVIARTGSDVYTTEVGTSMASPYVAGAVALWLQANPTLTPKQVLDIFSQTSITGDKYMEQGQTFPNNTWGYGRINVIGGLQYLLDKTVGISETKATDSMFRVTTDRLARTATFYFGNENGRANVAVYNTLGQQVYSAQLTSNGETISLSTLPSGVYVFKLQQGESVQTIKAAL